MEQLKVHNPATGDLIATIPVDSSENVAETVGRVRTSQAGWEAMGVEDRHRWLRRSRDWPLDNAERVLDTRHAETGTVRADAANEIPYLAGVINFYGSKAAEFIGDERIRPHTPLLSTKKLRAQYRTYPVAASSAPGTSRWYSRWATLFRRSRRVPLW